MENLRVKKLAPTCVMPEVVWQIKVAEERIQEIKSGIERYENEGFTVPVKWIEEKLRLEQHIVVKHKEIHNQVFEDTGSKLTIQEY